MFSTSLGQFANVSHSGGVVVSIPGTISVNPASLGNYSTVTTVTDNGLYGQPRPAHGHRQRYQHLRQRHLDAGGHQQQLDGQRHDLRQQRHRRHRRDLGPGLYLHQSRRHHHLRRGQLRLHGFGPDRQRHLGSPRQLQRDRQPRHLHDHPAPPDHRRQPNRQLRLRRHRRSDHLRQCRLHRWPHGDGNRSRQWRRHHRPHGTRLAHESQRRSLYLH